MAAGNAPAATPESARGLLRPTHRSGSFAKFAVMRRAREEKCSETPRWPNLYVAVRGQALSDCPPLRCRCRSRARASLRNRHQGPSIMGFEDEVEQSVPRPCRQTNGRSKRTCELTSSIVPRGTSFHRSVELEFPPIDVILDGFHCCGLFPGPAKFGAVNPDAMHDNGQPTCQGHDRFFHPAAPGDLHRPGLKPGPFLRTQHAS